MPRLNYYYSDSISAFLIKEPSTVIGEISLNGRLGHITTELDAWQFQIELLKSALSQFEGHIFFEFSIPRMGKRVDCVVIIQNVVFILEFKVGERSFLKQDVEQVWDYALDLKNFHEPSHNLLLVPILIATRAEDRTIQFLETSHNDQLLNPLRCNASQLKSLIEDVLRIYGQNKWIEPAEFVNGSYMPTPTIIEATIKLFNNHSVADITHKGTNDADLEATTAYLSQIIEEAKTKRKKVICFITGVPGAGKTLVGLKVATEHLDKEKGNSSVYLSGNKPLVDILQEALVRDRVKQEKEKGNRISKREARESVKAFIQIIHHYRDEYLRDPKAPFDHVAIFDEAQRAWNKEQTVKFMQQKKGISGFDYSEPEFLISCLNRHKDWAVILCLVGGGQEINTGEAGIAAWLDAIRTSFPFWETRISNHLSDKEYDALNAIAKLQAVSKVEFSEKLHLSVSLRSFKANNLSRFIKEMLDLNEEAISTFNSLRLSYPIVITRDIQKAKEWLREKSRGSQRYGIVVSSQAYRLKPMALDVKTPINHVNWFLEGKDDIRSSYFLEDVATEFQVQGLELDWVCVTWDADLRYSPIGWKPYSFKGNKWQNIHSEERKKYLINAYRVLLTRARQGMIIVVPEGNCQDHTRLPDYYNPTFKYLKSLGLEVI